MLNDSALTCTSAASPLLAAGPANLSLTANLQDLFTSTPFFFTYYTQVALSALSPTLARYLGGSVVMVTGTGFIPSSTLSCLISGQWMPATSLSSTLLTCVCPPVPAAEWWPQTETVVVSNVRQLGDVSNGLPLVYYDLPRIASVSPLLAWTRGGVSVTVTGSSFVAAAGAVCVFGGVNTTAVASSCEAAFPYRCTQLLCSTPAHAARVVAFSVVAHDGQDATTTPVSFSFYPDPSLRAVVPPLGLYTGGQSVSILGDGLFPLSTWVCRFNGSAVVAATYVDDPTLSDSLQCVTPSWPVHAQAVEVDVSADGVHFGNSSLVFRFTDASTISEVVPPAGPILGSSLVTLTGTFAAPVTECSFGGSITAAMASNATLVQCYSPAAATAGVVSVLLYDGSVLLTPSAAFFTYYAQPTVADVLPLTGPVTGGTVISMTGAGFVNNGLLACQFNGSVVRSPPPFVSSSLALCTSSRLSRPTAWRVLSPWLISNNAQDFFPQRQRCSPTCGGCGGRASRPTTGRAQVIRHSVVRLRRQGSPTHRLVELSLDGSVSGCTFLNSSMVHLPLAGGGLRLPWPRQCPPSRSIQGSRWTPIS